MAEQSDLSDLLQQLLVLQSSQGQSQNTVSAVSLKLPEFWTKSPEVWFARVESQFNTRGISDDQTRYDYVVSTLDVNTAEEIQAVLVNPPSDNKYNTLKNSLIKTFGKSQSQRDFELLNLNGMGDKRPTALLRKINALNDAPQTLKRALFLSNLPSDIQCILASQNIVDLDQLAEAADRVWETKSTVRLTDGTTDPRSTISDISSFPSSQRDSNGISTTNIDAVRFKNNRPQQNRWNRPADQAKPFVCFYHTKYGKAQRCQPGCSFFSTAGNDKASR